MKKYLLLVLLFIISISFMSNLFAQVSITIGDSMEMNSDDYSPTPYGTYWKNFREQYLIRATELNDAGGGSGVIEAISFNVASLNNVSAMPNYRIRMKHTTQNALISTFETGDYTQVFQSNSFMPVAGWNLHNFSTPFNWDGESNILVDVVCDLVGQWTQNASVYYTNTGFNSSLRFQDDYNAADTATSGYTSMNRSNMRFLMQQLDVLDMAALRITGPNSANINSAATYSVRIKNLCIDTVSNYTVKLLKAPNIVLSTQAGVPIDPMEELEFEFTWTPTEEGAIELFGRVEMLDDEKQANDNTPMFPVTVMPEGLVGVAIGEGSLTNDYYGDPTPYGTYYENFREQYLIRATEINNGGGGPGEIYGISFNVANLNNVVGMPNYRIRLKHTEQQELTTVFELGDYTQVFQSDSFMPVTGWNLHSFSTPFVWNGASNILVDVVCDFVDNWTENASVYYTNTGFNSSLRYQSDSNAADMSSSGAVSVNRSNMILTMQQLNMMDMSAISIVGPKAPNVNNLVTYTVRVKNLSPRPVSDYMVMFMGAPDIELDRRAGIPIDSMEELEFEFTWTPTEEGAIELFGRVVMSDDENPANDDTSILQVEVLPEGLLMMGDGYADNQIPISPLYCNSYSQTIYLQNEIGISDKQIESISYYWSGGGTATNSREWEIWMGHTPRESFESSYDWILEDNMTLVFSGETPPLSTHGWVDIQLQMPFAYNNTDNLVIAVRKISYSWDGGGYYFYSTPSYAGRTLLHLSDYDVANPAESPAGSRVSAYPNIKMYFEDVSESPVLRYSPDNIDFGTIFFNAASDVKNVRVFNVGSGVLQLGAEAVRFTGENAALFSFDDSVFPLALATGELAQIPVSLVGRVEGDVVASLEITYAGEISTVGLSANVLPDGVVIIGNTAATTTAHFPFGYLYGYERSAALYKFDEVGGVGMITNVGWDCTAMSTVPVPYKIYIGTTDFEALPAASFNAITEGFMLVSEGEIEFNSLGWNILELSTPFAYTGGNLVVAVETNFGGYGGNGYPSFRYTASATATNAQWTTDNNPPTGSGTLNTNRPNLMLLLGGFGGDPELFVYPDTHYEFPSVVINTTAQKEIKATNIGGGNINITGINITGDGFALADEFTPVDLGSGNTHRFTVEYSPTAVGDHSATLIIETSVGDHIMELSGSCIDPIIRDFPFFEGFEDGNTDGSTDISQWNQIIGSGSSLWTANNTETSNGRSPRSGNWNATLQYSSETTLYRPIMLEEGNTYYVELYGRQDTATVTNATIRVSYGSEPTIAGMNNIIIPETGITYGNYRFLNGMFTAPSTGLFYIGIRGWVNGSPWYLSMDDLTIMKISNDPVFSISANEHDFDEVKLNDSASESFTIKNEGIGALTISSIEIDGDAFSLVNLPTLPISLNYKDTMTFDAVFSPDAVGDYSATIIIVDNVDTRTVTLTGSCFDPTIYEFPFFEGFEDGFTNNRVIAGNWAQVTGPQYTNVQWFANNEKTDYNRAPRSGEWNACLAYNGQSTLIRPMALEGGKYYVLEMYARQDGANSVNSKIKVSYAADITQIDFGDTIIVETGIVNGDYQQLRGYFQPEEGGIYYLGITGWQGYPYYLSIDDIRIFEAETSPVLAYSPESISFGEVFYGESVGPVNITINNNGLSFIQLNEGDVEIVGPHAELFSIGEDAFPMYIWLGDIASIPLYVSGDIEGEVSATLVINYADEEYEIELTATVLPNGLVAIGDGTADTHMPIYPWNSYSYTQTLYMASDITTERRQIDKIAYHWNGAAAAPNSSQWTVYMGHTQKTVFTYTTDWVNINELTEVYQGDVDLPAEDMWIELMLPEPFWYNGVDNLVIAVLESKPGLDPRESHFNGTLTNIRRSLIHYNSLIAPNPASPPAGEISYSYPNIRLHFGELPDTPALYYSPKSIDFGDITFKTTADSLHIEIMNRGRGNLQLNAQNFDITGPHADLFSCYSEVLPIYLGMGTSTLMPIYVYGMVEGPINATLIINYAGEEYEVELRANVLPEGLFVIGDETWDYGLPVTPGSNYSYSQTLYMANEIMTGGGHIKKLAYHWNGAAAAPSSDRWTIYIGHTQKPYFFNSIDWVDIEDLTEVYQGIVDIRTIEEWIEIELDTTFEYNGNDNLVIAILESKSGNDGSYMYFYNSSSPIGRSIRYVDDDNPIDLNQLSWGSLTDAYPNTQIIFEMPFDVPTLQYRPTSIDFGEYTLGGISRNMPVKIRNAGLDTLTLNASDLSITGEQSNMFDFDAPEFPINLEYAETANIFLHFSASSQGEAVAEFVINYGGEEHVVELQASVLPEGIIHVGDPSTDNLNYAYGFPTPYGNNAKMFREQYLIKQEEIAVLDSEATYINSVAFKVHSADFPFAMPNYRIRIKETLQENLESVFEAGEYTLVYQADEYYPEPGWNIHTFNEPFHWDGESNLLIDVEIDDLFNSGLRNATVYNTETDFNSAIRYEVEESIVRNPIYTMTERPNMLLVLQGESIGELSGVVTENGRALAGVEVSIIGTNLTTVTDEIGQYHFPLVPSGSYTVTAAKSGYDDASHTVIIIGNEVTVQNFSLIGYPEYAIDTNQWDFGVVYVGESASKSVVLSNPAGGELVIESITIEGGDAFTLSEVPQLPFSLYSEDSSSFEIVFAPLDSGEMEATVVITDNLNRSRRLGVRSSQGREVYLSPYEVLLSGQGKFLAELGHQQLVSAENNAPNPYTLNQNGFREQYLILAEELWDMGIFPGYIDDISFDVAALNDVYPMTNHQIRFKHTQQNSLSDVFEQGDYEGAYFAEGYQVQMGWNTHDFQTPFLWDGYSNILVDVFSDHHANINMSASVYHSETSFNSTLRSQASSLRAYDEELGITVAKRANLRLGIRASNIVDLAAVGFQGSIDPVVGSQAVYTLQVLNLSREEITEYSVLLLDEDENQLASVAGTPLAPLQTKLMGIPWIPEIAGETKIFARIVMQGDDNPDNNDSQMLNIAVFAEGVEISHIGSGERLNLPTDPPSPYATSTRTFREQYLFTMDDLYEMGAAPGEIRAISFGVTSIDDVYAMQNYRIRIKTTEQDSLGYMYETGAYTQVYQRDSFMPVVGINMHYFEEPFLWNGWDNLLVDIVVDDNNASGSNAVVYHSFRPYNASLSYQGSAGSGVNASSGTPSTKRPNTIWHIISEQLGSIEGLVSANGEPLEGVEISLDGTDLQATTGTDGYFRLPWVPVGEYVIKGFKESHAEYSKSISVGHKDKLFLEIDMPLLPKAFVSGRVLGSDRPDGLAGARVNLEGSANYAVFSGIDGNFSIEVFADQEYELYIHADRYISYADLIEVGLEDIQLGNIVLNEIAFPASNLTAEINPRYDGVTLDWDAPTIGGDVVAESIVGSKNSRESKAPAVTDSRSLVGYDIWRLSSGDEENPREWDLITPETVEETAFVDDDWLDLPDGSYLWALKVVYDAEIVSEPVFSNELIKSNTDGLLAGFVLDSQTELPIAGAQISIDGEFATESETDGSYSIEVVPGPHVVSVTHTYFHATQAQEFVIRPSETTNLSIMMQSLPRVEVSGTILASDTGEGLEGAILSFLGFMDYEVQTAANGRFALDVYAGKDYSYTIMKDGYVSVANSISVADVDLDMGEITLYEIAYPPSIFIATVNQYYTAVNLGWDAPAIRGLSGYQLWRFSEGLEDDEDNWTLLNDEPITATEFVDESWATLDDGSFGWAVKAIYPAGVISDAIFSNMLSKSNSDGILSGTILDDETDLPIAGVTITIDEEYSTTSDQTGRYVISLSPGPHSFSATHIYYEEFEEPGVVVFPDQTTVLDLAMQSLPKILVSGSVSGTDTDGGLAGAVVSITGFADYELETNADGGFAVQVFADKQYAYTISKDGYESAGGTFHAQNTALDLGHFVLTEIAYMPSGLAAVINDSYTAVELTWDAPQIRGLEGYQVWRMKEGDRATEDEWSLLTPELVVSSIFEDNVWTELPDGDYLWAVRAIYTAGVVSEPIFSNELYKSNADGLLAGLILDEADNSPIVDATITVDGEHIAVSDEVGAYRISLAPGPHTVVVSHTYYEDSDELGFVVYPDQPTNLNIELESLPRVLVSGIVLASDTGEGLGGVDISVTGFMDYSLQTATDGSFSILAYAGYTYSFTLSKAGYESYSSELAVGDQPLNLGEITLYETAYQPSELVASVNESYTAVGLTWNAPAIRGLESYQVWRMTAADKALGEEHWDWIGIANNDQTSYIDEDWQILEDGDYLWAIKAIYTAGVTAEPIFSNTLTKSGTNGLLAGFILDEADNSPIVGAIITVDDEFTTVSDNTGAYSLSL
ncbi:MAG: carboxypeptidase regulatory-like domain-containing protein, partial [Candidatus Cloacimonetes bacterium]|nr:carboxypeptidase regulatory-like domain-containing protein [Candidatus Cloacimonadota bacterium]